jgi:hypothetical protein
MEFRACCQHLKGFEISWVPVEAQDIQALEPFFCHSATQARLETLELTPLMLAPDIQR